MIKQMTLGAAILVTTLGIMSTVNAQTENTKANMNASRSGAEMRAEIKENKGQIEKNKQTVVSNKEEFRIDYGFAKDYLRTDLTADEKAELLKLKGTINDKIKYIVTNTGTTTDAKVASLKELKNYLLPMVSKYIKTEKVDAFSVFIDTRIELFAKNQALRDGNKDLRKENKDIRVKLISEKTANTINKKLDTVPTDKQKEVFSALIVRIDAIIADTTDATKVQILTELKNIVQKKLNELSNATSTADDVVNSVLGSI